MLAGCTGQRETLRSVSAEPELPAGEFYHEPLRVDGGRQFNLHYEVAADGPFDVFLFGGQSNPEEFGAYRRTVEGTDSGRNGQGAGGPGGTSGRSPDGDGGHRASSTVTGERPDPSGRHSVMGVSGQGEVDTPLAPGTHHFVVDNTRVGEATPDGPLHPEVTLEVRDYEFPF